MSTSSLVIIVVLALAVVVLRRVLGSRTVDATWLTFAKVPFNAISFRLRRAFGWRRGLPVHANETKEDLFDYVEDGRLRKDLERRERDLRKRYDLEPLAKKSRRDVYRDNLYTLDLLDKHVRSLVRAEATSLRAADVGSKDFRYAFALERLLVATTALPLELFGIEIDGHPVYPDLRSRADHAEAYAAEVAAAPFEGKAASTVTYRIADYLTVDEKDMDVVFFFFPFVLRYALVRWGLPLGHFKPEELFEHAARALRSGGLLVIVNHTREEHAAQRALLDGIASFEVVLTTDASSHLVDYYEQLEGRMLTVAVKR